MFLAFSHSLPSGYLVASRLYRTCALHPRPFLSILIDVLFYSNTHRCMYLSCTITPVIIVSIYRFDFPPSARLAIPPSHSACHVLNPMRHLNRLPTVFARPRPPCPDPPCLVSRPLSSFGAADAREHLRLPATDHVPRFDWRLRVPSPKPPLSAAQKVLEKRAQPPLPTDSHPYNVHIQKYKDQSVICRDPFPPIGCSPRPQFPPPLII